ncbi:Carboxy-terminal domain (CTD) phosphatase [Haplosporangium gracile]|nr:Carboxy-terminal domain (CTD) phosphatase [Haplosporangium gracile]
MADNDFRYTIPAEYLPATIIAIKTSKDKSMSDGDELLEYEYVVKREGYVDDDKTALIARRGEIRATKDGVVEDIHVTKGQVIDNESTVVIDYKGCDHDTQYEGMCVMCCKTVLMNQESHVRMAHDATSLAVSRTEAKRLEHDTVGRLLNEGKLSLIVDLDQTLIHATVGPAIDEWINSQGGMPQDVKMFPLPDSSTPYYIKLRPYLERFLQKVAAIYELHIYTMGTRNYASAVAKAIDPDGKFFSQRILSRDENLNMTQKSIERLFPCDTSMVVVIDDRADVWQYSPNLVKVHPYEYFVGAGDINAGHLPKQDAVVKSEPASTTGAVPASVLTTGPIETKSDSSDTSATVTETLGETEISSTTAPADATATPADATATLSIETSEEKKPEKTTEEKKSEETESVAPASGKPGKVVKSKAPVMDDNDNELKHILEILETIHEKFYDDREVFKLTNPKKQPDVKEIIRGMKKNVLKGVNIVFSSVIPLGQIPQRADIWRQAESFGAICSTELSSGVTHVVAAKAGTQKVSEARRRKHVKLVRPEWLYHSIGKWQRQNEADYVLPEFANKSSSRSTTPPHNPEDEKNVGGAEGNEEEDQDGVSEDMGTIQTINNNVWEDAAKELEDELGDLDDTDFDSDTSTHSNTQSDASTDGGNRSPLVNLKRTRVFRKSGLSTTVTSGGNDDDEDEDDDSDSNGMNVDMIDRRSGGGEDDDDDKGMSTQDSDGDIDDESGSDSQQGYSDAASDASASAVRQRKRKRRNIGKNGGGLADTVGDNDEDDDEDGMDADDEVTMDHTLMMQQSQEDEDDDDDDFLNDLENDLDAQLNDD